jgi:bifunctional DNA-binding transcriptional regulator/antitoxin component of YhaV-PrlF toxin-antitoxin module
MKKLLYILFPLILFGCKSASVVELIEIHDTLRIVQVDTLVKEVKVEVRDTIRIKVTDSVIVNIDKDGNVSKERYHEENKVTATERDTQKLDAKKSESKTEAKTSEKNVQEEEEKPSAISKAKGKIVDVLVILFFSVISFMIGWIIRAVKDK